MYRYLSFLLGFLALHLSACRKDILLTEDTYTELTIKHENFPDFSYAGYERNEKAVPLVPVRITLEPSGGDESHRIQEAIDQVSALAPENGFRGAVLLKAGTYEVGSPLFIRASGVVLRGEGQGEDGTVLIATSRGEGVIKGGGGSISLSAARDLADFALIRLEGRGQGAVEEEGSRVRINASKIAVGSRQIPLESPGAFRRGDTVRVVKTANEAWIEALGMSPFGWTSAGYQLQHTRIVTGIEKNILFVDIPMVDAIEEQFGGGYVAKVSFPGRISQSGVENLRIRSVHSGLTDERHTWTAIRLSRSMNCWVRNVTALHFSYACVSLHDQSDFNTIQDCFMLEPRSEVFSSRRYHFYIGNGMGNLFQRCYSEEGRHDFVTGSRVSGPNVFLDCYAEDSHSDSGPHHRWATGILFDNVSARTIRAQNRAGLGSGQGWAGAQILFWNCEAERHFQVESPPGAINWVIGGRGAPHQGDAYWASWGIPVRPRSLFLEQLHRRLGPAAVELVTIPSQRNHENIWQQLKSSADDGSALSPFR